MDSEESLWASAPYDILALVLKKLPFIHDYLHFSLTCKSWLNVAREEKRRWIVISNSHVQPPLLLIPEKDESNKREEGCGLYDVINKKKLDFQLTMIYNRRCAGSSHGWLFFSGKDYLTMLNPFTNKTILLPAVKIKGYAIGFNESELDESEEEKFYSYHVKKAVLSCDPSVYPNNFEVVATYGGMYDLAIFRAGDSDWTFIENHPQIRGFRDMIYHKGAFYAIDSFMGLGRIEVSTTSASNKRGNGESDLLIRSYRIDMIAPRLVPRDGPIRDYYGIFLYNYLVESSKGDLIFIMRRLQDKYGDDNQDGVEDQEDGDEDQEDGVENQEDGEEEEDGDEDQEDGGEEEDSDEEEEDSDEDQQDGDDDLATIDFKVYKLLKVTQSDPYLSWIAVDTLGGDTLFLGDNHSMAINADGVIGYRKNSIYYTDDSGTNFFWNRPHGPRDMGIFNFDERCFESYYPIDDSKVYMPVWIVPSLGED